MPLMQAARRASRARCRWTDLEFVASLHTAGSAWNQP